MCARTTCRTCGKATISGCGQHVEQALRGVPQADRCGGHARSAAPAQAAAPRSGSLLSRLFGGE